MPESHAAAFERVFRAEYAPLAAFCFRRLLCPLVVLGALMTGCAGPNHEREQLLIARDVPAAAGAAHPDGSSGCNSSGCVSIGDAVVIAPPKSVLIDEGIIVIASTALHRTERRLRVGEPLGRAMLGVEVDRGSRFVPKASDCGATRYFLIT